jgi:hypothetical protein
VVGQRVEAGLSETGGGITGALCEAAWRVVPDPMSRLHHISAMHRLAARRCSGSFHSYSHAKRGASPLRLPACRAGQQCVSPPNRRPGPRSSRWGSVFPEAEQAAKARHSCSHAAASSRGDCCVTNSRTGTSGSSATSSSASATMPHERQAGPAVVVAVPGRQEFAVLSLANY